MYKKTIKQQATTQHIEKENKIFTTIQAPMIDRKYPYFPQMKPPTSQQ